MSREWKPGDVARIEYGGFDDIAVRIDPKDWAVPAGTVRDANVTDVHPLVVIDPEDREAVERLVGVVHHVDSSGIEPHDIDELQAALREYANPKPPKPEEPQGLGAVVEDIHGRRYQRVDRDPAPWLRSDIAPDAAYDWRDYDQINAVRVLSPGVEVSA